MKSNDAITLRTESLVSLLAFIAQGAFKAGQDDQRDNGRTIDIMKHGCTVWVEDGRICMEHGHTGKLTMCSSGEEFREVLDVLSVVSEQLSDALGGLPPFIPDE